MLEKQPTLLDVISLKQKLLTLPEHCVHTLPWLIKTQQKDLQNTTQKLKNEKHEPHSHTGVNAVFRKS
jgi:hypothetical protein